MTTDEVKQKIIKICEEINAPIPVIMAIAGIESNFNPSAKSKSGTFVGIFQLSNGWGGCNGANSQQCWCGKWMSLSVVVWRINLRHNHNVIYLIYIRNTTIRWFVT